MTNKLDKLCDNNIYVEKLLAHLLSLGSGIIGVDLALDNPI